MENKHNKSSDYLYLERLQFKPELRKTWLNFFVTNFRVVILLIILISTWGLYSFFTLPRESNPEVKIPIAVVITTYPGASPSDIEELVTKKLETGISGLKDIKKITSSSANSVSSIRVEFDAKADLENSIRKLRDEVNNSKTDLPDDANDPVVKEISFDDQAMWTMTLTGPYDGATLHKYAENIKDELEKIPDAREVDIFGGDEKEFEVAYDPQKLASFGLSADSANQLIKATNLVIPAGSFDGKQFVFPVRSDARVYDEKKIAKIPLFHTDDGSIVYVSDVATIKEKNITRTIYSRLSIKGSQPQEAVTISIIKKTGGSIIDTAASAQKIADEMVKKMPAGITYDITMDMSKYVKEDFDQLGHDFKLTILLVGGILFLIVGLKEAIVAGLAVPLVFFVTFGVMDMTGISLNFLSILSLLLSLGLLVDDAIVVVSATKQYINTGKFTPEEAVLLVLNDFKVVLTTTTLTTVWAFLPLLSASGIIGSYIKSIPITVSVTLIASLLIALMINHPLAAVLERIRMTKKIFWINMLLLTGVITYSIYSGGMISYAVALLSIYGIYRSVRWYLADGHKKLAENIEKTEMEWADDELIKAKLRAQGNSEHDNFLSKLMHGILDFHKIIPVYEKFLRKALETKKSRAALLLATAGIFVIAILLPISGIVPTEFFPASDSEYLYVSVEAPTGLKLDETDKIVETVEQRLLKYPEIINFSTVVGNGGTNGSLGSGKSSTHLANITVNLSKKEERQLRSYELATKMRDDMSDITDATVKITSPSGGPPSGSAFEARISGDDLQTLDRIAHELKPSLSSIPGVVDADISLKESPADYTFTLDPERMELYNLNAAYVGSVLRMAISGTEVTTILREGKETKVVARFEKDKIPTLESIQNLQIVNTKRQPVFLKDVAKIELKPSVDSITRIDQKRTVLLSAGVEGKTRPNAVLTEFQSKIAKDYQLPDGYTITYGGENEQNTESVLSIIRAMVVAGILIISTLIIQFNSFKKAMIVLVTIPLALIGVFFGMALTRVNLTFPGLIGILALFGIVVKNAIILIDKINLNLKSGIEFDESIVDACKSRLEAIFITSICTIFGLIPVTLSNETWTALGSAIIFGLVLSSLLTLFIVPTLFRTVIGREERF